MTHYYIILLYVLEDVEHMTFAGSCAGVGANPVRMGWATVAKPSELPHRRH